jgi:hypothetical protein
LEEEKKIQKSLLPFESMDFMMKILAERTGLEPATLGVTGRYSNQLNYRSVYSIMLVIA